MAEAIQVRRRPPPARRQQRQARSIDGVREVAQELEAVFLAQVLAQLEPGLGGAEQTAFHDMFNDQLAKLISRSMASGSPPRC